jgi:dsDNA-specific endonuclease/ATPase MutS2
MSKHALKAGDKVSFLNETGGGVVLRLLSRNRALIRTDDGFELEVAVKELVHVAKGVDEAFYRVNDQQLRDAKAGDVMSDRMARDRRKGGSLRKAATSDRRVEDDVMEVDLHLHELIDDERHLTDGEKLEHQLRYFERMLNTAIGTGKRKLIVIHGVGEGRLRDEVRKTLGFYDVVRFHDANPRHYGYGATEVEILRHRTY